MTALVDMQIFLESSCLDAVSYAIKVYLVYISRNQIDFVILIKRYSL